MIAVKLSFQIKKEKEVSYTLFSKPPTWIYDKLKSEIWTYENEVLMVLYRTNVCFRCWIAQKYN